METVDCEITVSAYIDCPNEECGHSFDLFEIERLTDDGLLYRKAFGDGPFGCSDFGEKVMCPDCETEFKVGQISW